MNDVDFAKRYGPWAVVAGGIGRDRIGLCRSSRQPGPQAASYRAQAGPLETVAADIRKRHGTEVRRLSLDLTTSDAASKVPEAAVPMTRENDSS